MLELSRRKRYGIDFYVFKPWSRKSQAHTYAAPLNAPDQSESCSMRIVISVSLQTVTIAPIKNLRASDKNKLNLLILFDAFLNIIIINRNESIKNGSQGITRTALVKGNRAQ